MIALKARAQTLGILVMRVDESYAELAFNAFQDYIEAKPEQEFKHESQLLAAQMLLIAHKFTNAYQEYQKILDVNPDDVEALLGAGAALIDFGYGTNDKAKIQQGIDDLQRFVDKAPEGHRYKGSAEEALSFLKQPRRLLAEQVKSDSLGGTETPSGQPSNKTPRPPIPDMSTA